MDFINGILGTLNDYLYAYILIVLLIGSGIYFTIRCKFVQVRMIPEALRLITKKSDKKDGSDGISPFQALMVSTASHVGIGNIAGVATAIASGGAGAVFWMWLTAIVGMASSFTESTLAQVFKSKDGDTFRGGPAYYIEKGLKNRPLGIAFAVCLVACFAYGFNTLQANNIASALDAYTGGSTTARIVLGAVLAGISAFFILGGQKKIAFISSVIVPFMAIIYMGLGLIVIVTNIGALPGVIALIFKEAFDLQAIFGGFMGSAVMLGVKRGLFSNEAGLGSSPNAAATANVSHPVKQGLAQMMSVFIDTILICSTSAFIVLLSGVDYTGGLSAMPLIQASIAAKFGNIGVLIITISVFFFAFSSIIGNYFYTESNMAFIQNRKTPVLGIFRVTVIAAVFLGAIVSAELAWNLSDVLMGLMGVINIIAILALGGIAFKALSDYQEKKKQGQDPSFKGSDIGLSGLEYWND